MLEAVVLGVVGVLQAREIATRARLETLSRELTAFGVSPVEVRSAALQQLGAAGDAALVSRTLHRLRLEVPARVERQLVLRTAESVPATAWRSGLVAALRPLASAYRLAFLDDGDPACMDRWVECLGLAGTAERRVWTGSFGRQARFPSPYAFRWLADRFGLRASECLYVAGTEDAKRGAEAAGWNVLGPSAGGRFDIESLPEWLCQRALRSGHTQG